MTQRTVQLWIDAGLVCGVLVNTRYQVLLDSLYRYLEEQAEKPNR